MRPNSSRTPSIKSIRGYPEDLYTDESEEDETDSISMSAEDCIDYCIKLVPNQLGLQPYVNKNSNSPKDHNIYNNLTVERLGEGITNSLYKVTNILNKKTVVVRVFGASSSKMVDRNREHYIHELLSKFQIGKSIYCYFKGGLIEEWIEGRNLTEYDLYNSNYMVQIAQNLKKLHSISMDGEMSKLIHGGDGKPKSELWPTVWKYHRLAKKYMKKMNKSITGVDLRAIENVLLNFNLFPNFKIPILEEICNSKNSPLVLCHADLLAGNIILKPDDHVRFIDFEYCCCMERAFDISNHLNEYMGNNINRDLFPNEDMRRDFIREYLKYDIIEWRPSLEDFCGQIHVLHSEDCVDEMVSEIEPFFLASHLLWGLWGALQSCLSNLDFDFEDYSRQRLDIFMKDPFWEKQLRK
uniref:ethanolamine kinase n=1 Tax=Theileria annulata TaxID=5874 RepID=A0A3B0N5J9_THEAN